MEKLNISLQPDQMVWFTSDCHFGHRNILTFCQRPFETVNDMGREIVRRWNEIVGDDDYVFILGDMFWFDSRHSAKKIVGQLKGKLHLIPGNHDKISTFDLCSNIKILSDISVLFLSDPAGRIFPDSPQRALEIVLCHYPLCCYSHSNQGALNFFGHIHSRGGRLCEFEKELPIIPGQQMDVGMDRHNYRPVSIFELLDELKEYQQHFG